MVITANNGMSDIKKKSRSRIFQYVAAITANLGIVCSEMHYGWPSPSLPILKSGNYTFTIGSTEESLLAVIPLIGAIFGAFITGLIVDILGRKNLIVFSSLPFTISWILVAVAKSSTLMFIGRFIAGAIDGMSFTAVPMYLGEIAEPEIRGLIASVCPVCIIFGILLINILGSHLAINVTAYIATAIPILLLITFMNMPESPYFYLIKGKTEEARRSLQVFRGVEEVSEELDRISLAIEEQKKNRGNFLDLFTVPSNRKSLIIAFGLRGVQQLSGTTAIIFFCKKIFIDSGDFISPSTGVIVYFSVQLVLSALSSFIVDISGRRPLLIISMIGTTLTIFVNATYLYIKNCTNIDVSSFNFVPLVALLGFVIIFSIGLQTIPLLIMGEIFATDVKGFALCLADMYYSILVTIISLLFHYCTENFGLHVPFFMFGCFCILGLIFIIFVVPETKGKTLEDIQRELRGEKVICKKDLVYS